MADVTRLPTAAKRRVLNPDLHPVDPDERIRRIWPHDRYRAFHLEDPTEDVNITRRWQHQMGRERR